MRRGRILIIEDESTIRQGLCDALISAGYEPFPCVDGPSGMASALKIDCDLVLLDLTLPGCDGLEILEQVRRARPTLPFIILTARGSPEARIRGLRTGSDDYVIKPFNILELLARIEAVLRRSPGRPLDLELLTFSECIVDLKRCEIRFTDGQHIPLSERELNVLRYLANSAARTISREEILAHVWRINPRSVVGTRAVDMLIARLREKLRDDPVTPRIIQTVRGKGYMICLESGKADE